MIVSDMLLLAGSAVVAGAINAIAGGGTLVSFPAAMSVGLSALAANATNSVALTPGSIASAVGYRKELARDAHVVRASILPMSLGGVAGALLLLVTPVDTFKRIVPLLVLFATGLLLAQNVRRKRASDAPIDAPWVLPASVGVVAVAQFLVGVYGGYFGAGMGIMTLAILARLGGENIHRMNAVKNVLSGTINAIAALVFVVARAVEPLPALVMAVGAIVGGFVGASIARRVNPTFVRWAIVALGLALTGKLALSAWA